jgi:hypothetical protein
LACWSRRQPLRTGIPSLIELPLIELRQQNLRARRTGDGMANTATIRNANGLPATFAGSKTGQDDAPFVFVKVGDEERRMRWAEWDALPAWIGPRPARTAKD